MNLSLKWEAWDLSQVQVSKLDQYFHTFHSVLESDLSVFVYITEILGQNWIVLTKILRLFISKL